jgi:hypothetical protein
MHVKKRRSHKLRLLYAMNGGVKRHTWFTEALLGICPKRPILSPVLFDTWCSDNSPGFVRDKGGLDHEDAVCLAQWRQFMPTLRAFWHATIACQALNKSIENVIDNLKDVRKIVGFGLGSLEEIFSIFAQHFFVFEIASKINKLREKSEENVRVILQDPATREKTS